MRVALTVAAVVLLAAQSTSVQARTWTRVYVEDTQGGSLLGRYTLIHTADGAEPRLARALFEDDAGYRLVARSTVDATTSAGSLTIKSVATGETLSIEFGSPMTLSLGAASLNYDDAQRTSQPVRSQAATLFGNASAGFRHALGRFVSIGVNRDANLNSWAMSLQELLFPNVIVPPEGPTEQGVLELERVQPFDPAVKPPNPFEAAFGADYYN